MKTRERISLKPDRLGSLTRWMFIAHEAATAHAWVPPRHHRSDDAYADVSASGIYPAPQSRVSVGAEDLVKENAVRTSPVGERPADTSGGGGAPRSGSDPASQTISATRDVAGYPLPQNQRGQEPPAGEPPRGNDVEPAITEVYRECAPAIHRMMLRLGIPERYAEDATNDVFVTALPRWNEFRGDSSRRTWLFGFALKVAANQRRKLGRAGEEKALAADHDLETSVSPSADPFEEASARQSIELLSSLLDTLTLEERALWLLVYYEDVSVADAAQVIGMSAPKAYVLAKWVHAKLIKAWKRSNPPEAWRPR